MSCRRVGCLYSFVTFTDFMLQKSSMYNAGVVVKYLYILSNLSRRLVGATLVFKQNWRYIIPALTLSAGRGIKRSDHRKKSAFSSKILFFFLDAV